MSDTPILDGTASDPAGKSPPRQGRPVDHQKGEVILRAARDEFFEHGYGAATIEGIARRADVSKVTIYNRFETKQALFAQAIAYCCLDVRALLQTDVDRPADLRDHLVRYGTAMLAFLGEPQLIRFENMLGGEMERHPDAGPIFLNSGPRPMMAELTGVIAAASARGDIHVADPKLAAELLGGMIKGFADFERRFDAANFCNDGAERRVRTAVDIFLTAFASPTGTPPTGAPQ